MKTYVVKQGDYLKKIAHEQGFDADALWNDPKNTDLKAQRTPNILCPGDVLYLPESAPEPVPFTGGTENNYSAQIPEMHVRLGFKDASGPIVNEPYVVDGLGDPVNGTTDGDGMVDVLVPVTVREIQITFPNQYLVHPVLIGDMDPIEEASGVRKRLQHLGYLKPKPSEKLSDDDVALRDSDALVAFQTASALPASGTMDDATKDALVKAHGC